MNHTVNPLARLVLRSPAHRLLSGSLAVLDYTGRKSGKHRSLPVMYAERDGELIVFAGRPGQKRWWRNFRGGGPVGVVLRGDRLEGHAKAVMDDAGAIAAARALYTAKFPKAGADGRSRQEPTLVLITLAKEADRSHDRE